MRAVCLPLFRPLGLCRVVAAVLVPLALAACEKADNQPGPGGVTVGEGRALDEAAQMIESATPPPPGEATGAGPGAAPGVSASLPPAGPTGAPAAR